MHGWKSVGFLQRTICHNMIVSATPVFTSKILKCAFEIYSLFFSFVKELLTLRERASEIKLKGMKNTGIWQ